ncbi:DinB family protein [Aureibacter tunicatorum]|uniref:DinB-like domain-containing protein n=1 Tax=Aureibacter tunicatorum TaxID=866807 RepID=A0AAE3XMB7_9BACT|nr:DinB family protein [Aureibacter tunicatorum]MDR6238411.1 hypothetical protein [Aureibacter tunicatorum]BDD03443.1 hypothetical protein AUTU_09260 [Aureibacter tunicatorum]
MKVEIEEFYSELLMLNQKHLSLIQKYKALDEKDLRFKIDIESWSCLECIEHLNYYGEYYTPYFELVIENSSKGNKGALTFKSGWLGGYFAKSMKPEAKKMKTLKVSNPLNTDVDIKALEVLENHLSRMQTILREYREEKVDLQKNKIPISLTKWIKINLGDALKVVVYHNDRHFAQCERLLALQKNRSLTT